MTCRSKQRGLWTVLGRTGGSKRRGSLLLICKRLSHSQNLLPGPFRHFNTIVIGEWHRLSAYSKPVQNKGQTELDNDRYGYFHSFVLDLVRVTETVWDWQTALWGTNKCRGLGSKRRRVHIRACWGYNKAHPRVSKNSGARTEVSWSFKLFVFLLPLDYGFYVAL